jgi:hypothetical protein
MDAGGSCSSAPPTNVRSVTIVASGIDFGDKTQTDWETIGFNLDAQCTTAASTGVCTLSAGAPKSVQVDGVGGIDNSFGANICPLIDTVSGAGACSSPAELVYVVTDAAGNGLLSMAFNGQALQFPITDAFVAMNGNGGGTLAAVAPTAGFIAALRVAAGHLSVSLCSGAAFQSIATQIQQDADILTNGSNVAGQACDGISLGMTFASSTPLTQPLPPVTDPCGD